MHLLSKYAPLNIFSHVRFTCTLHHLLSAVCKCLDYCPSATSLYSVLCNLPTSSEHFSTNTVSTVQPTQMSQVKILAQGMLHLHNSQTRQPMHHEEPKMTEEAQHLPSRATTRPLRLQETFLSVFLAASLRLCRATVNTLIPSVADKQGSIHSACMPMCVHLPLCRHHLHEAKTTCKCSKLHNRRQRDSFAHVACTFDHHRPLFLGS